MTPEKSYRGYQSDHKDLRDFAAMIDRYIETEKRAPDEAVISEGDKPLIEGIAEQRGITLHIRAYASRGRVFLGNQVAG